MPSDVIRGALENGERSDTRPFFITHFHCLSYCHFSFALLD